MLKTQAKNILNLLLKQYPSPKTSLNYSNQTELLVAVILSAQCTDKRVNIVTKELFKKYNTFKQFAQISKTTLIKYIRPCGYFNSKAEYIIESSKIIRSKYKDNIPNDIDEITKLKGVGRKTANVILSEIYNLNYGIAIDTHNKRVSKRLGLTKEINPIKIEKDLMKLYPKKDWKTLSLLLVEHGRTVCKARKPICNACILSKYCEYYRNITYQKV